MSERHVKAKLRKVNKCHQVGVSKQGPEKLYFVKGAPGWYQLTFLVPAYGANSDPQAPQDFH